VVSHEEKAPLRCQVGAKKANVSESLRKCRDDYPYDIETGVSHCPRDDPAESRRSGRLDVLSTLIQATKTILLLVRLMGGCCHW
jgi:hypothetical protein